MSCYVKNINGEFVPARVEMICGEVVVFSGEDEEISSSLCDKMVALVYASEKVAGYKAGVLVKEKIVDDGLEFYVQTAPREFLYFRAFHQIITPAAATLAMRQANKILNSRGKSRKAMAAELKKIGAKDIRDLNGETVATIQEGVFHISKYSIRAEISKHL